MRQARDQHARRRALCAQGSSEHHSGSMPCTGGVPYISAASATRIGLGGGGLASGGGGSSDAVALTATVAYATSGGARRRSDRSQRAYHRHAHQKGGCACPDGRPAGASGPHEEAASEYDT